MSFVDTCPTSFRSGKIQIVLLFFNLIFNFVLNLPLTQQPVEVELPSPFPSTFDCLDFLKIWFLKISIKFEKIIMIEISRFINRIMKKEINSGISYIYLGRKKQRNYP